MEKSKKITLAFLSLFQIVISCLFFVLGMVDGFEIRFVYVSLVFSPCWIVPLVGSVSHFFQYVLLMVKLILL